MEGGGLEGGGLSIYHSSLTYCDVFTMFLKGWQVLKGLAGLTKKEKKKG